jgi:GNAT superfamily N-acetyltransferase
MQSDKQRDWIVRNYRHGDEDDIFKLWLVAYPERGYQREKWMKWWCWMYMNNPAGDSRIWIAAKGDKIIGHCALMPLQIKIGPQVITGYQTINSLVDPDCRKQGIITMLKKNVLDEFKETEPHIIIGFPNAISYMVDMQTGYLDIANFSRMMRVFKWQNYLRTWTGNKLALAISTAAGNAVSNLSFRPSKTPEVQGLTVARVSRFDERINEFWDGISGRIQIAVVKNQDYLNWRFITVPDVNYAIYIAEKAGAICGYLVMQYHQEKDSQQADIYDFLAESEVVAQSLLATAMEQSQKDSMDCISWMGLTDEPHYRALRKRGFLPLSRFSKGKFVAYSIARDISKDFLKDRRNWLIQKGDSDIL